MHLLHDHNTELEYCMVTVLKSRDLFIYSSSRSGNFYLSAWLPIKTNQWNTQKRCHFVSISFKWNLVKSLAKFDKIKISLFRRTPGQVLCASREIIALSSCFSQLAWCSVSRKIPAQHESAVNPDRKGNWLKQLIRWKLEYYEGEEGALVKHTWLIEN